MSAWWLRRNPGRLPPRTALLVGVFGGLAGLVTDRLTASVVGLLALADLLWAGTAVPQPA